MLCFTTVALVWVSQLHDNTAAVTASSPAQPARGPQSGQSPTPASLSPSNQPSPVSQTHTLPDRARRCETSQAALYSTLTPSRLSHTVTSYFRDDVFLFYLFFGGWEYYLLFPLPFSSLSTCIHSSINTMFQQPGLWSRPCICEDNILDMTSRPYRQRPPPPPFFLFIFFL